MFRSQWDNSRGSRWFSVNTSWSDQTATTQSGWSRFQVSHSSNRSFFYFVFSVVRDIKRCWKDEKFLGFGHHSLQAVHDHLSVAFHLQLFYYCLSLSKWFHNRDERKLPLRFTWSHLLCIKDRVLVRKKYVVTFMQVLRLFQVSGLPSATASIVHETAFGKWGQACHLDINPHQTRAAATLLCVHQSAVHCACSWAFERDMRTTINHMQSSCEIRGRQLEM